MIKKLNKKNYNAFTLLEMSIVILILSILFVGGINLYLSIVELSEKNLSADRIYVVNKALSRYLLTNMRLPCPSDITLYNDDPDYAKELRSYSGDCEVLDSRFSNGDYIAGGVPTKELGLPTEYTLDAWDSKVVYVVNKKYATNKGFFSGGGASMIIEDVQGNLASNKAIYVLISPGPNQNGAFKNGYQNTADKNLLDKENLFLDSVSFDNRFVKDVNNKEFDDIVLYNDKSSLIFELDMEDIPCSLEELYNIDNDYPNSSVYCTNGFCLQGVEIYKKNSCGPGLISENPVMETNSDYKPIRRCQKYGQWSNIMYECIPGCGIANAQSLTCGNLTQPGELYNAIESKYLLRVKAGDTITLDCGANNTNKTGYIVLKCDEFTLQWTVEKCDCLDVSSKVE